MIYDIESFKNGKFCIIYDIELKKQIDDYLKLVNPTLRAPIASKEGMFLFIEYKNTVRVSTTKEKSIPAISYRLLMTCKPEQIRPTYYGGPADPLEPVKVINAWALDFELGNAIKYIARAGKKDSATHVEDLKKAITYINLEIQKIQK